MKRFICMLLSFCIVLQLCCIVPALAAESDGFEYEIEDDSVVITGYSGSGNVVIPAEIEGRPVTAIEAYAFAYSDISSVKIPSTITEIRNGAFIQCKNLERIVLPEGLIQIGSGAFDYCEKLSSITIPDSVREIGIVAFAETPWLANQTEPFVVVGDHILLKYNGNEETVVIPEGIKALGGALFYGNETLKTVQFPSSLRSIQESAFSRSGILSVELPSTITEIRKEAFWCCENLERVVLSEGLIRIESGAFGYCDKLSSIIIPDSVGEIGSGAFAETPWLANQTEPFVVVGDHILLKYNGNEEAVVIPEGIKTVGSGSFYRNETMKTVQFPNSLRSIMESAFSYSGLTAVEIPENVTIARQAFEFCTKLTSAILPKDCTEIPESFFFDCINLQSVDIPTGVTTIGRSAFYGCVSLTQVTLPDGLSNIGHAAFIDCLALKRIEIPENVKKIDELAFYSCLSLTAYVYSNSYAQNYMEENEIPYRIIPHIKVLDLGFYEDEKPVYTLSKRSLRAGARVSTDRKETPILIGALYKDSKLIDVKVHTITTTSKEDLFYTEPFDLTGLNEPLEAYTLKAFIWEKSSMDAPLKNASIDINSAEPYPFTQTEFAEKVDGSTVTLPLTMQFAMDLLNTDDASFVQHNKTAAAIQNLIDGNKEIIFTTYPSEEDFQAAKQAGVELECAPVVNDAFIFLANIDNPVTGLTQAQIRDIYSGKVKGWTDIFDIQFFKDNYLDGKYADDDDKTFLEKSGFASISAYQRNTASGSQTGMQEFMGDVPLVINEDDRMRLHSMGSLIDAIAYIDNAIGYSYYYFAENQPEYYEERDQVKYLAVDGVLPSNSTISSGEYPIITPYYAIIRKDAPEDSFARKLLNYALSARGQAAAEAAGYVGIQ